MAGRAKAAAPRGQQEPPPDWRPTQAVDEPILNGPYDEPTRTGSTWTACRRQTRAGGRRATGTRARGRRARRPTSSPRRSRRGPAARQPAAGRREALARVGVPRRVGRHAGPARVVGASDEARRLFFCQREAVETLIYLLELRCPGRLEPTGFQKFEVSPTRTSGGCSRGERPGFDGLDYERVTQFPTLVDPPRDPDLLPLTRLGCKMATGSGKTVVMAMLITWAFCNRGATRVDAGFPTPS